MISGSATRMRLVLIIGIVLGLVLQVGVIALGQYLLDGYTKTVSEAVTLASSSKSTLDGLTRVEGTLKSQSSTVEKSKKLVVQGATFSYQDQIVSDITTYATQANLEVKSFTFSDTSTPTGTTAATPAPTAGATAGTNAVPLINGVKSVSITIAPSTPAQYSNVYLFLQLLEQNLLKIQVKSLTLSKQTAAKGDPNEVDIPNLILEVYKKQ